MVVKTDLSLIIAEGEGQTVEFKERLSRIDREMVAFANASGGAIFIGIADNGEVLGILQQTGSGKSTRYSTTG